MLQNYLNNPQSVSVTMTAEDLQNFAREVAEETVRNLHEIRKEPVVWLTAEQVAKRLNKTAPTLWRWEKEGYLIPERFGRRCRYKESDVILIEQAEKGGIK